MKHIPVLIMAGAVTLLALWFSLMVLALYVLALIIDTPRKEMVSLGIDFARIAVTPFRAFFGK